MYRKRCFVLAIASTLVLQPQMFGLDSPAVAQSQSLPDVADLADRVLPAVVEISVESKVKGAEVQLPQAPDDSPFKDFFDDFLNKRRGDGPGGQDRLVSGMGSGFVVDPWGFVVTNNHVIDGAERIEVKVQDGRTYDAVIVGRDAKTDLAVLRIKPQAALPSLKFGDSNALRIGEWVMAIGNPFGLGGSVSLGIVSARNRDISSGPYDDFIQTDAAINKGNSGGPLFNMKGEVVGVNTAIFSPTGGSVGIGFSVPASTVQNVVQQLIKYQETRRGWLGVKLQQITADIAQSMNLPNTSGALVADVTAGGPSEKAGLESGDVIIEFDGKPITEMRSLPRAVGETDVGKQVKLKVLRKGSAMSFDVELGRLEDGEKVAAAAPQTGSPADTAKIEKIGVTVNTLTDAMRQKHKVEATVMGVVVTEVTDGSPAADKKLAAGDVIVEAAGKKLETAGQLTAVVDEAIKSNKTSLLLLVAKGGKESETRFFALKLTKPSP